MAFKPFKVKQTGIYGLMFPATQDGVVSFSIHDTSQTDHISIKVASPDSDTLNKKHKFKVYL